MGKYTSGADAMARLSVSRSLTGALGRTRHSGREIPRQAGIWMVMVLGQG